MSEVTPYLEDENGCWIWQRSLGTQGYGQVRVGDRVVRAHRHFYEREHGPIPEGRCIDHICRVRACVNPAHLRICTQGENLQNLDPAGRGGSSRFRGVFWSRQAGKWQARVKIARRQHYVGLFRDEEEAGDAAARFRAEHMPFSSEAGNS